MPFSMPLETWPELTLSCPDGWLLSLNHDSLSKAFLLFAHVGPSAYKALYPSSAQKLPFPWGFPKLIIPPLQPFPLILIIRCSGPIQCLLSTYYAPELIHRSLSRSMWECYMASCQPLVGVTGRNEDNTACDSQSVLNKQVRHSYMQGRGRQFSLLRKSTLATIDPCHRTSIYTSGREEKGTLV